MKEIAPILTVFISGFFGLLVALLTWKLSLQREKSKYQQDVLAEEYKKIETFYTSCLASIYKVVLKIDNTDSDESIISNEFSLISAQASILANELFNKKLGAVCSLLSEWQHYHKLGSPKKFGDTGLVVISTNDQQYINKAETLQSELMKEVREFTQIIKMQLNELKLAQKNR